MKQLTILFISLVFILSACGTSDKNQETKDSSDEHKETEEMAIPEVEVQFEDQPLPIQEETTIKAVITQGEEKVEDADYVEFEVWKDSEGQENSEKLEANHSGDGIYEISYSFESKGTYQVIAHTQARSVHVMPQVQVQVGEGNSNSAKHDHNHGDESGQNQEFMVKVQTDKEFKVAEETNLTVHINRMEQPFTEAHVQFQVKSKNMDSFETLKAKETKNGEYIAPYTFSTAGKYVVIVHYKKSDQGLHGHQEQTIEVVE